MFKADKIIRVERGKHLLLFLICLFLAFIIWSIHNLSESYSHSFQYKIYISTKIAGRNCTSGSVNNLTIRGRASGFYIIQHRLSSESNSLTLSLDASLIHALPHSEERFYLLTSDITNRVMESVSDRLNLDYISSDTLFFDFPKMASKEVAIAVKSSVNYKEQYTSYFGIRVNPSIVTITGEESRVKEVDSIYTQPIIIQKSAGNESGFIKLRPIYGIDLLIDEVYYTLETVRYVEQQRELAITLTNLPDSLEIEFSPSVVKLSLKIDISKAGLLSDARFLALIDYNKMGRAIDTILIPEIIGIPDGVISYKLDPPFVQLSNESKNW